ncbi:TPA: hypothetical protein QDC22_008023 [Burkholderia stabilis]|nr:hypothetical protein [Burkholderia stabilis]HDR9589737.1 hypothetical protein [Burkholderia stabilis]HDR9649310.1 hypothetical protein [Burkholderia stabilis]HDR9654091.1 hypothetical protein [Burkholderia stabilis]HDR9679552.1 hypothetical protein [Burkholderia stabilis]
MTIGASEIDSTSCLICLKMFEARRIVVDGESHAWRDGWAENSIDRGQAMMTDGHWPSNLPGFPLSYFPHPAAAVAAGARQRIEDHVRPVSH